MCRSSILTVSALGGLVLDGPTLADIFLGKITKWDDPAIKKLNPNLKLPSNAIVVVHRSDGSGTTFIFTDYLSKVSPDWKSNVGASTSVEWPVGIGAKGNEGVSNNVAQTKGAIGYVEYAYALQNKMTTVKMINKDGKAVEANSASFQAAAANADWANSDNYYVVLTNEPGADSWPIAGATFILMYKQPQDRRQLRRSAQVLRLGLYQGQQSRRRARLCAVAARGHCANRKDLGGNQGARRQACVLQITFNAAESRAILESSRISARRRPSRPRGRDSAGVGSDD